MTEQFNLSELPSDLPPDESDNSKSITLDNAVAAAVAGTVAEIAANHEAEKIVSDAVSPAVIPTIPMSRPSVLSLAIKEKAALYAAYMPFLKNGGIFVPTSRNYQLGDEIYLILSIMEDPQKYPVAGRVVWINFENTHSSKVQGIGVHFPDDETGQKVRSRIEELLGTTVHSTRSTHTL